MDDKAGVSVPLSREGKKFSPSEGLKLAKVWVRQSENGANQNEPKMWEDIVKFCSFHIGFRRTPPSMKSKWHSLQRDEQVYLAAQRNAMSNLGSGVIMYDCKALTMKLHYSPFERKDKNGNDTFALYFHYLELADFLTKQLNFYATRWEKGSLHDNAVRRKRTHISDDYEGSSALSDDDDVTGMDAWRRKKGKGIKVRKREVNEKARNAEVAKEIKAIWQKMATTNKHLKEAINGQKKPRSLNHDLVLFQVLQNGSSVYLRLLSQVLYSIESSVVAAECTPDYTEVVAVKAQTSHN